MQNLPGNSQRRKTREINTSPKLPSIANKTHNYGDGISAKTWKMYEEAKEAMKPGDRENLLDYANKYFAAKKDANNNIRWADKLAPESISWNIMSDFKTNNDTPNEVAKNYINARITEYDIEMKQNNTHSIESKMSEFQADCNRLLTQHENLDKEIKKIIRDHKISPDLLKDINALKSNGNVLHQNLGALIEKSRLLVCTIKDKTRKAIDVMTNIKSKIDINVYQKINQQLKNIQKNIEEVSNHDIVETLRNEKVFIRSDNIWNDPYSKSANESMAINAVKATSIVDTSMQKIDELLKKKSSIDDKIAKIQEQNVSQDPMNQVLVSLAEKSQQCVSEAEMIAKKCQATIERTNISYSVLYNLVSLITEKRNKIQQSTIINKSNIVDEKQSSLNTKPELKTMQSFKNSFNQQKNDFQKEKNSNNRTLRSNSMHPSKT